MNNAVKLKELACQMSILYVEDEKKIREELEGLLGKFFAIVHTAKNGHEGLERFADNHYDIVLTDVLMPIMEGTDMIEQIRKTNPSQVVIINTAYDYADYLIPKYLNGANFFLPKPSDHVQVIDTLLSACKLASGIPEVQKSLEERVAVLEQKVALLEAALQQKA